jgi:hypothetical protein
MKRYEMSEVRIRSGSGRLRWVLDVCALASGLMDTQSPRFPGKAISILELYHGNGGMQGPFRQGGPPLDSRETAAVRFESLAAPFAGLSPSLGVASRPRLEAKKSWTLVEIHERAVQPGGPEQGLQLVKKNRPCRPGIETFPAPQPFPSLPQ